MPRKRKTKTQKIVGAAAAGLPQPAQALLGSRLGSTLVMILVPALIATGILQISWQDGKPKVSVDKERAREVEQRLEARAEHLREEWEQTGLEEERPLARIRDELFQRR